MDNMDPMETMQSSQMPMEQKKGKKWLYIVIAIVIIALIVLGVYFGLQSRSISSGGDGYNAVFLTNGQVYFGKINKSSSNDIVLKNVYYLQLQQPLQQGEEGSEDQKADISLVKLGNELHGPEDEMIINREHVLFTEKLKGDSKVVEAIKNN